LVLVLSPIAFPKTCFGSIMFGIVAGMRVTIIKCPRTAPDDGASLWQHGRDSVVAFSLFY
jgi:hypothetical protein